tara:strand:- start:9723 stop:10799 length:1077 start_codon:yes stop_codon:yes gene_type:complete
MIKTIFPTQDATIYSTTSSMNTGIDEILEIQKVISGSSGPLKISRALLQFDTTALSSSFAARGITTSSDSGNLQYFLKMFVAEEKDVPNNYSLAITRLDESWVGGLGRSTHIPNTEEGCSWTFRDGVTPGTAWTTTGGQFNTSTIADHSQSFTNVQADVEVNITDMVHRWLNGTIANNGLIVYRSGSQETDSTEYGTVKYFSRETNTIYPPRIEARYNTVAETTRVETGMVTASADDMLTITAYTQPEYRRSSETRVELNVEPKFPTRSQGLQASSTSRYSLPIGSTYAIIDSTTNESIIPHATTGSLIVCNKKHYIDIDMGSLFPERYYYIQVKVPNLLYTGSEQFYDTNTYFKVIK